MDYQFWVPVAVSVIIGVYGLVLQHLQLIRPKQPSNDGTMTQNVKTWLPRRPLLIMVALVVLSWLPFTISRIESLRSVTTLNIHSRVDKWTDDFHLGRRLVAKDDSPDSLFAMEISVDKDRSVIVAQSRDQPQYLTMRAGTVLTDVADKTFGKLTQSQRAQVKDDVVIAMANLHMGQEFDFSPATLKITKLLPITSLLTEIDFISAILDTDTAVIAGMSTLATSMRRYQPSLPDLSIVGKRLVKQTSQ